ncbi:hypothetical protein DPMN_181768 [Dreissena polymorpha]|uniref:Uncharacterized protein n=1 Tax=Dreissena polymorpha TaxID=45954 RepID=A0A9D4DEN2_DREPO|nr:hypothetical protein DPMN_181768 [Dreissena polymorpha]
MGLEVQVIIAQCLHFRNVTLETQEGWLGQIYQQSANKKTHSASNTRAVFWENWAKVLSTDLPAQSKLDCH